jgi:hypothetical protein
VKTASILSKKECGTLNAEIRSSLIALMDSRNCVGVICTSLLVRYSTIVALKQDVLGLRVPEGILGRTVLALHRCNLSQHVVFLEDGEHRFDLSDVCHMRHPKVAVQNSRMIWVLEGGYGCGEIEPDENEARCVNPH